MPESIKIRLDVFDDRDDHPKERGGSAVQKPGDRWGCMDGRYFHGPNVCCVENFADLLCGDLLVWFAVTQIMTVS